MSALLLTIFSGVAWASDVAGIHIDDRQVTRAEFLVFVKAQPEWRKDSAPVIFADASYLKGWKSWNAPGRPLDTPVTEVSWFAAQAYCRSVGKRLPTIEEWEMAAAADEVKKNARDSIAFRQRILNWYARPGSEKIGRVRSGYRNAFGLWDMHGLVWEWTEDFNSVIISPEACGAGGGTANASETGTDRNDYPNFMRNAFRSSLRGNSTVKNLGFRCATDKEEKK